MKAYTNVIVRRILPDSLVGIDKLIGLNLRITNKDYCHEVENAVSINLQTGRHLLYLYSGKIHFSYRICYS
jgi:hypothetical protein